MTAGHAALGDGSGAATVGSGLELVPDANLARDALPGYEIVRELHRGGQGVVYQAIQKSTQRNVAIKVLREGALAGPAELARFEREARILAQLRHPNIVTVHDRSEAAGVHFFVMDYISGQSLEEWGRGQGLFGETAEKSDGGNRGAGDGGRSRSSGNEARRRAEADFLRVFVKVCRAVQAAHERGIVHRDLKPANVRVDGDGEPHVLDFGLAKSVAIEFGDARQTQTGQFLGSVPWASPEQADGAHGRIGPASDVYSLGVILYRALVGRFPYEPVADMRRMLERIIRDEPIRPRRVAPRMRVDIETILLKCLEKRPERRYADAGALAEDLERYLAGLAVRARRPSVLYQARMRAAWLAARHPVVMSSVMLAAIGGLVYLAGSFGLFYRSGTDTLVRRAAMALAPDAASRALSHVRLLALTDETPVEALAREAGLEGVSASNPRSLRRLHGRMMERLAAARPAVLAWDIFFEEASEYDEDFVRGVARLREAGTEVVLATRTWRLDEDGLPGISPTILRSGVRWGTARMSPEPLSPWSIELALLRPGQEPRWSLALAAFAAYRRPGCEFSLTGGGSVETLELSYWTAPQGVARARRWSEASDAVSLTAWALEQEELADGDLRRGDQVGVYVVHIPGPEVIGSARLDYAQVFRDPASAVRERLEGRAVFVADTRGDLDRYAHASFAERIPGGYVHLAGLDSLIRGAAPLTDSSRLGVGTTLIGLLIGVATGRSQPRSVARRGAALAGAMVLVCGAGVILYWQFSWLINPFVALLAGVLASESIGWVVRSRAATRT